MDANESNNGPGVTYQHIQLYEKGYRLKISYLSIFSLLHDTDLKQC